MKYGKYLAVSLENRWLNVRTLISVQVVNSIHWTCLEISRGILILKELWEEDACLLAHNGYCSLAHHNVQVMLLAFDVISHLSHTMITAFGELQQGLFQQRVMYEIRCANLHARHIHSMAWYNQQAAYVVLLIYHKFTSPWTNCRALHWSSACINYRTISNSWKAILTWMLPGMKTHTMPCSVHAITAAIFVGSAVSSNYLLYRWNYICHCRDTYTAVACWEGAC